MSGARQLIDTVFPVRADTARPVGGCTDAALTARAWWRPTYPAFRLLPPLVTLDHIVVSGLRSTHVTTARIPGSDHLAVIGALARQPVP